MLVYIASLAGLERPYEDSLGSFTDQKAESSCFVQKKGDYSYQFYGRPFDKEEEKEEEEERKKKIENLCFFVYVSIPVYFTSYESIVRCKSIHRDGNVSKKAQNCSVREFRAVLFV